MYPVVPCPCKEKKSSVASPIWYHTTSTYSVIETSPLPLGHTCRLLTKVLQASVSWALPSSWLQVSPSLDSDGCFKAAVPPPCAEFMESNIDFILLCRWRTLRNTVSLTGMCFSLWQLQWSDVKWFSHILTSSTEYSCRVTSVPIVIVSTCMVYRFYPSVSIFQFQRRTSLRATCCRHCQGIMKHSLLSWSPFYFKPVIFRLHLFLSVVLEV